MIDIKNDAIEYFDHNPHSEGVVFIMIDKCDLIDDYQIDDNCDFNIVSRIDNENCITKEEQITQSIDNSVSAWRNGDITIDDLIETLKAIKGGK